MGRSKKSRKVGLIGVRKDPDFKPSERRNSEAPRPKKHKGKPAGSRNNVESQSSGGGRRQENKDPRHGSKKPISLEKQQAPNNPTPAVQKRKYATPEQELAALEADQRLASLLDKLDDDQSITKAEQAYVNEKMARHRVLCDLLGIVEDDDEGDENDPFDELNAIDINDFKK